MCSVPKKSLFVSKANVLPALTIMNASERRVQGAYRESVSAIVSLTTYALKVLGATCADVYFSTNKKFTNPSSFYTTPSPPQLTTAPAPPTAHPRGHRAATAAAHVAAPPHRCLDCAEVDSLTDHRATPSPRPPLPRGSCRARDTHRRSAARRRASWWSRRGSHLAIARSAEGARLRCHAPETATCEGRSAAAPLGH